MLLIVGHPSIGSALETLLRVEDRYDTRRIQSLDHLAALDGWTADVALIDGVLAQAGRAEVLAMPVIVLSGNAGDGKRLAARLPTAAGWLRKDATYDELRVAIDRILGGGRDDWRRPGAVVLAVIVVIAAVVYALLAFGPKG